MCLETPVSPSHGEGRTGSHDKDLNRDDSDKPDASKFDKGPRFWAIIATLCVIGLLSSLENTVVTTSLSLIVTKIGLGENYIWVTNIFFLTRYHAHSSPTFFLCVLIRPLLAPLHSQYDSSETIH
jgi:hypothetical protein